MGFAWTALGTDRAAPPRVGWWEERRAWERQRYYPWRDALDEDARPWEKAAGYRGATYLAHSQDADDEWGGACGSTPGGGTAARRRAAKLQRDSADDGWAVRAGWCPDPPQPVRCVACGELVDGEELVAARHVLRCWVIAAILSGGRAQGLEFTGTEFAERAVARAQGVVAALGHEADEARVAARAEQVGASNARACVGETARSIAHAAAKSAGATARDAATGRQGGGPEGEAARLRGRAGGLRTQEIRRVTK